VKEYLIKSGLIDRRRMLILTDDYFEFENGDLKGKEFTRFNRSDIIDFKHGMDWIVWYKFTVGRQFSITVKATGNKELKIEFNSYFGLGKENVEKYKEIINDIWRFYHSRIVDNHLDRFYNEGGVEIEGIKLKSEGIELGGQRGLVSWDTVGIKDYHRYFAIYNRDNPEIHSRISYNRYGAETLWSAVRTIIKEKEMNASERGCIGIMRNSKQ
jgi:hypothetical protein